MRKPMPFVAQFLLFVAFACLVILDASILPLAFLIIFLGTAFASAGIGVIIPAAIFFLVLSAGLVFVCFSWWGASCSGESRCRSEYRFGGCGVGVC